MGPLFRHPRRTNYFSLKIKNVFTLEDKTEEVLEDVSMGYDRLDTQNIKVSKKRKKKKHKKHQKPSAVDHKRKNDEENDIALKANMNIDSHLESLLGALGL